MMSDLAIKICNFIYKTCECHKSFEDFVTETTRSLYDVKLRKGIAADLKGMAEYCEDDNVAREASMLWREVMAI